MPDSPAPAPFEAPSRCAVLPVGAFVVEFGALSGDAIGAHDEVVPGDVYTLDPSERSRELILARGPGGSVVAQGSAAGRPGDAARPLARHQVMGERGVVVELLVLDIAGERVVLPLGPLLPGEEYTLISSAPAEAEELSGVAQVSFATGTRITVAGGRQVPVEALSVGDRVLTRDHGFRPVRWTGRQTVRAEGPTAPVVIGKGVLNNADDLMLSPDHRLFIYQRHDAIGAGGSELLVRARHLVNGETIWRHPDGYVEYHHLLFDAHEIIYVEGIPAESLLVSPEVLAGMGEDLAREVRSRSAGPMRARPGIEPSAADLDGLDASELLRRAWAR